MTLNKSTEDTLTQKLRKGDGAERKSKKTEGGRGKKGWTEGKRERREIMILRES